MGNKCIIHEIFIYYFLTDFPCLHQVNFINLYSIATGVVDSASKNQSEAISNFKD